MRLVFKASLAILIVSATGGQSWVHGLASDGQVQDAREISRECPALAIEAVPGQTSRGDVVRQRDRLWRTRLWDMVAGAAGEGRDSCRSG